MANFTGDSGNNNISGTTGADTFDMSQGGNDTVLGDDGDDVITFGRTFDTNDVVRGGAGYDVLALSGDTYTGLTITSAQLLGVEEIQLAGGDSYTLATGDHVVGSGTQLYVNGYALGSADALYFDGSAETNGSFQLGGGHGDDTLIGGAKGDWIYSSAVTTSGGSDTMQGNAGSDIFLFSGDFDASDRVNGGTGSDVVSLSGDYSAGFTIGGAMLTSIEQISLDQGNTYKLTSTDANVASGKTFEIDASAIFGPDFASFDGSAETNGKFKFLDSYGNDVFTGGTGADFFEEIDGGNDTLNGGAGNDTFDYLGGAFDVFDKITGGTGLDTLILWGTQTSSVNLSNLTSIEHITLYGGAFPYKFTAPDSLVPAGHRLTLDGSGLGGGGVVSFNGSNETDGHFTLIGGPEADTLTGGSQDDILQGNHNSDTLKGGAGSDTYSYLGSLDSTGLAHDTIIGFNAQSDKFNFIPDITKVDATIHGGALTTANFDGDISTAVNGHLGANEAILFEPTSGDFAGKTFLIVDGNGFAGYNGSDDYAILLQNPSHLLDLTAADFI